MVWFILAGMAAFAALAAVWPVLRPTRPPADADWTASETAFYKAQLDEIRRDSERGQLPQSEAASARAEAARRLIAVPSATQSAASSSTGRARLVAVALIAVGLPMIAFPLYAYLGRPQMPDEPLASRRPANLAPSDIEAAVAGVEAHLIAKPDDGKGWAVIAPVYMRLGRYDDAAHAYSEALRLVGEESGRRAAYGEALVASSGGVVTDKAREAFVKAVAEDPSQPQARFYLALAAEQDGKTADAIHAYESLIAGAPPDAHWIGAVKARLASLKGEPPPSAEADTSGAAAVPEAQKAMIEGMVSRLASRLASDGGNVDEWARLIRAYTVLHEAEKAKAALANARKALAPDPNAVASLDALAHDLGLGDAN
jgi:cytochrome c-type biogenesis protein CcmH